MSENPEILRQTPILPRSNKSELDFNRLDV